MITVPHYTQRDLSPEQIERQPVHRCLTIHAPSDGPSLCGYGLPGRWTDDNAEVTCDECRAILRFLRKATMEQIAALRGERP